MQIAPLPYNEADRISNLLSYEILDTAREKKFDDLVKLAAQVSDCKYALVSFIDSNRQWFKAMHGIEVPETSRSISVCAHTILGDKVMVINDIRKDKRFFDNPNVVGGYRIAFYAGTPIVSSAGFKLGTVCAMDDKPKENFSLKQKRALKIIADQVAALLELGVSNKRITTHASELVAAEKDIVQKTITEQEEEKNFIANELHENFAQTLAATKLYLDFAEQSKELSAVFIRKAKANILQIIRDIKALSKSMLPSTFQNANYLRFIQEMLEEYGKQNKKEIEFVHQGKLDAYDSNIGLTIFRIIQYLLKSAHSCGANKISITIKTAQSIKLYLSDDGRNIDELEPDRKVMLRHIEARLSLVKGTLLIGKDKKGNNLVELEIPLEQEEK